MIPLRDENPSYGVPWMVLTLIAINVAVFFVELSHGLTPDFFMRYGLLMDTAFHPPSPHSVGFLGFLTSVFVHAGFAHLFFNMYALWLFGDNVEWLMGRMKFLLFYLLCGFVGGLTQILILSSPGVPLVGASGAIAGVMGAYLVNYPTARIITLMPVAFLLYLVPVPAYIYIGLWALFEFFYGTASLSMGAIGGVGNWAHLGGFAAGFILVFLFRDRERLVHTEVPPRRWPRPSSQPLRIPALDELVEEGRYEEARVLATLWRDRAIRLGNYSLARALDDYLNRIL
ncbi:MAG: rhomboid family intramembrane serine protease [bacterium JZ-2024 1]